MTDTIEDLSVGRGMINGKLIFTGEVTGGGAHGPGNVAEVVSFDRTAPVRWFRDDRSGSKRSGSCSWQLETDRLYRLTGIANGSRSSADYYVVTDGGVAKRLTREEYDAERTRRWPLAAQEAVEAAERRRVQEQERMAREAELAEARRIENEALKELNEERAAEIAEKGQERIEGLPELTGTPKQIAYALNIRAAYAARHPGEAALKRGTTAKYWIENHRSVLFNR